MRFWISQSLHNISGATSCRNYYGIGNFSRLILRQSRAVFCDLYHKNSPFLLEKASSGAGGAAGFRLFYDRRHEFINRPDRDPRGLFCGASAREPGRAVG